MTETHTPLSEDVEEAKHRSLPDDLRELADEAREYAKAEFAFQKSRVSFAGKQSAIIAGFGSIALVFAFFALMALVVGTVIALGEALTPWGSTAVVTGVLLALALLFVMLALGRWNRMKAVLRESEENP